MSLIWTIVIGFVVGLVARLIKPGKDAVGWIMTIVLGVGGSLLSTWAGQMLGWYQPGQVAGFIGAVVGAVILLVIWGALRKKA
ncbi:MAG TPA: GlsB/YeaQ/YmgE family stress response membrane protein [Chiayiivirga sp.]|nr:GlsB/YeaQ/YmgE family stress response membrane protein [Chiayiivirga sp.]